jgi:hypothetical protein
MERADGDGVTLEYAVAGAGEAVVCIHGAFVADTFRPLLAEPSLAATSSSPTTVAATRGAAESPGPPASGSKRLTAKRCWRT